MDWKSAEKLIGTNVEIWSSSNGIYCGELVEVKRSGGPWRGVVKITGVIQVAQHFEQGQVCRRGFRTGELMEAGGVNISPTDATGFPSYADALEESAKRFAGYFESDPTSRHAWASKGMFDACTAVLIAERHREATGDWDRKLVQSEWMKIKAKDKSL